MIEAGYNLKKDELFYMASFLNRLQPSLQFELVKYSPKTMKEAETMAKAIEESIKLQPKSDETTCLQALISDLAMQIDE